MNDKYGVCGKKLSEALDILGYVGDYKNALICVEDGSTVFRVSRRYLESPAWEYMLNKNVKEAQVIYDEIYYDKIMCFKLES